MADKEHYTAQEFIEAIQESGGIILTIASRVGCAWRTAEKYISRYPTVRQAYDDECEKNLDRAESVILQNIINKDSGDAKWYLSKKGKHRGYGDRTQVDIGGSDGGPINIQHEHKINADQAVDILELLRRVAGKGAGESALGPSENG